MFTAVCATAFAYEGWIVATSINAELKDAKRNLPKALIIGGIVIIMTYLCYYIGVAGGASNQQLIEEGATVAFTNIFGGVLGNILNLFVAISCLGTANGLMLACTRGMYSLASRKEGPNPEMFSQVDKSSKMPTNSAIAALAMIAGWFLYFYCSNLAGMWTGPAPGRKQSISAPDTQCTSRIMRGLNGAGIMRKNSVESSDWISSWFRTP